MEFRGLRSAILELYAAKIEATRRYLPRDQVANAVRALIDQQGDELRALAERKKAALRARREWRQAERFSARLARRREGRESVAAGDEARPS